MAHLSNDIREKSKHNSESVLFKEATMKINKVFNLYQYFKVITTEKQSSNGCIRVELWKIRVCE